ncbi:hypothetical protein FHR83_006459 [Actinoplanes campanulatus]|uniref:N-acetyltransferase domain-containing protein n=1 Tax=Actinoplanes campanulatus TaxID=113559 RepID=A0A7W5AMB6_9ACTN|nr:hypothetical protein [Actinoplanes campanulatus]MBB3098760.1 hypothetical protein [Actinoplanes campanulatus]GGN37158.1 hypothetical protein GCM10010109_62860 [Actinoplanes campanulatus]GID40737.1 hypothetical protein Aca09nite_72430 [Actinoplanes campanulatus]
MLVKVLDQITDDDMHKAAWELYESALGEMRSLAVQRHLMYQSEFDDVMSDPRVEKFVCFDEEGNLCGLATFSNDLYAMPLISPEYFERHWPELYRQRRIWYAGFVAVGRASRASRALLELMEAMFNTAAAQNGIIALDFCRYNDVKRNMGRATERILNRFAGGTMRAKRMDEEQFWAYEFPAAA